MGTGTIRSGKETLSNLLKSAAGTCPFCRQKADILSREHPECRRTYQAEWNETVHLAAFGANSQRSENLAQM